MAILTVQAATLIADAFAAGLRPARQITVSEWADEFRFVGKPSPEPGPWRTSRVPYTREIMDRLSPSDPCEIVILQKAAQGAGTEILNNALGCWMHRYPDSTMVVLPTLDLAKKYSRIRFDRMVEATEALRNLVAPQRSRDASNRTLVKEFGPSRDSLVFVGANSGPSLRSYPSRFVVGDEIDGYPDDVDNEGNPIDLIIQRTGAFRNRKIFFLSTPTLEDFSNVNRWYKAGDQRQYHVPCPLCGWEQTLIFGNERFVRGEAGGLRWPKGSPELARYQCEKCGDQFEEWRKNEILGRGQWIPSSPANYRAGVVGSMIRSYHINALYYPYGWPENAWTNLAAQWERDKNNPIARKAFINLKQGLPYRDPAESKADAATLKSRCEAYGPTIPAAVGALTLGVDVQANRLVLELVGWGKDEENWSIEYQSLLGDTSQLVSADPLHPSVWQQLDEYLKSSWLSELNVDLTIRAACIDSGYNQQTVREFCHERSARKIWPIKGREGHHRPIWPSKIGKQRGKLPPPFIVGVDAGKEIIYSRLKIASPGPGFCHFPVGRDRDYFDELTSEVRVPDYSGPIPRYQWRLRSAGSSNHALDARNYAYAALQGLQMLSSFRLNREVENLRALAESKLPGGKPRPTILSLMRSPKPIEPSDPYL